MLLIKKVFDYFVWLMFFVLLLLGGIIYVTDKTYPGNYLYPFKLKFENFALATSKILNKQVDFSIDLVIKRSSEVAKILAAKNSIEALSRLDTQVELTATSISQIPNAAEKKKAAEKYIAKLNEVSSVLSEKQKEFATTPSSSSNTAPQSVITEPVTQSVTQQPIQDIPVKPTEQVSQNIIPTVTPTLISEITPTVSEQIDKTQETINQTIEKMTNLTTNNIVPSINNKDSNNKNEEEKDKLKEQKNSNSDKETNEDREKNKDRRNEDQMK